MEMQTPWEAAAQDQQGVLFRGWPLRLEVDPDFRVVRRESFGSPVVYAVQTVKLTVEGRGFLTAKVGMGYEEYSSMHEAAPTPWSIAAVLAELRLLSGKELESCELLFGKGWRQSLDAMPMIAWPDGMYRSVEDVVVTIPVRDDKPKRVRKTREAKAPSFRGMEREFVIELEKLPDDEWKTRVPDVGFESMPFVSRDKCLREAMIGAVRRLPDLVFPLELKFTVKESLLVEEAADVPSA